MGAARHNSFAAISMGQPGLVRPHGEPNPIPILQITGYFGDLMATTAELAGATSPQDVDSISFVPTLTGRSEKQAKHKYLYWEFYEQGGKQAVPCLETTQIVNTSVC